MNPKKATYLYLKAKPGKENENTSDLVQGGWDDGVVKNIKNFKVLASKL